MTVDEQVSVLIKRTYRHRFDPRSHEEGWFIEDSPRGPGKAEARIRDLLEDDYLVRTGYYATSVRGYREYRIMYRRRKGKKRVRAG